MRTLILLVALLPLNAWSATFIGNGGNVGDVELLVTQKIIKEAMDGISREDQGYTSCECTETFENHRICYSLDELKTKQVNYCSSTLQKHSEEIFDILDKPGEVEFTWTHQPIYVREGKTRRGADAVTNPKTRTITINQSRFIEMTNIERIFLVTHELFHLVRHEGRLFDDEVPIGPFKNKNGGRELLNAMAAATVVQADEYNAFQKYSPALRRAKGWKHHWLDVGLGSVSLPGDNDNTYYLDDYVSAELNYRYYLPNGFGLILSYRNDNAQEDLLTSIEVSENISYLGVGFSYRFFPFSDPLTWAGQSHFATSLQVLGATVEHEVKDPFVGTKNSETVLGASLDFNYYMPLSHSIWWYGGLNLKHVGYKHDNVGLEVEPLRTGVTLGVSYGF